MNKVTAVYLRVSTEGLKNGKEQTTDSQRLDILAYLKSKSIENFVIYEDLGVSGTRKHRPSLDRMIKDCKQGKLSKIVVFKLDRLARSLSNLLEMVTLFQESGVEFISVKDSIDMSTATGRLLFQILGSFAEFEAATIKERVNSGIAAARAKGVRLGRPLKSGHSVVAKLRGEGKTVKEIADHTGLSTWTVYRSLGKNETAV